ncbi:BirA family biotin operon repressor/biotin-[acetyl-CoA-carboxylase] ligase [Rhodovulum adriaticum]|uniref:biotin--[biotin carboxyl-carrier protein] ligase n=2 Tax=Rhodovulum adriaticum TaxID=35804 RepID=A0A4R2NX72_RHOAD|nr:biotin--[acetyl-CoA-carboxylase] ligase [Rhodovulum adriaticum]TCP26224.1 BirA family biotin operon repressor/biotin-[acetyl-CoA-carboxylase] ligase [Rhodovulum adriaticum]
MQEARRRAPLTRPTWIAARRQTAAVGRRGRSWAAPEGNLSATFVFDPECAPAQAALYSFVASYALYATLTAYVDDPAALTLKWPNDVLLNDAKLAGILLASDGAGQRVARLAIGIGVNLNASPGPVLLEEGALPPITLAELTEEPVDPLEFLAFLAEHFDHQRRFFVEHGFGPLRAAWLEHAARLGQTITARTGREEIIGRFDTVDEEGQLVLETASGRRAIAAADVFF